MSEQQFYEPEEGEGDTEEEYDYAREPEPDEETLRSNEQRSRFFLAAMSFLLALLCLSAYLNNISWLNSTLLEIGVVVFAAIGIFFLLRRNPIHHEQLSPLDEHSEHHPMETEQRYEGNHSSWLYEKDYRENGTVKEDRDEIRGVGEEENESSPFEILVQEALASIPPEFQKRMENVFVRVEYEPDEAVLRRVGTKPGYTLLGLYEGVPLTIYGRQHSALPETITIYQRPIERYCHGDPDRIRKQVQQTVLHEVAHHFGIGHNEMPIWIR
jgi:predicted Zn-dependent protease with MMP-like domain